MFERGRRGSQEPPEWGLQVEVRLKRLRMNQKDFSKVLGVNYQHMNSVITGSKISPAMQVKILTKLDELEQNATKISNIE